MPEIENKAFHAMSYGLYLLAAQLDGRDNACIVDALIQSASEPRCVTVSCMAGNLTPSYIRASGAFTLSVLPTDTPRAVFERFGMQSGRDGDKFADTAGFARAENGLLYYEAACSFVSCEVMEVLELGSHVLITARVTQAQGLSAKKPLTYAAYRENLKAGLSRPAESHVDAAATADAPREKRGTTMYTKWVCKVCGYI